MGRSQRRQRPFAAAAAALLAVALLASGAAAATDPTPGTQIEPQPEPEWGIDGLRLTDPLADPEADVLVPDPEAYRLNDLSSMRSTAATTRSWALSGAGWGHGVGMSQYGAWEMAKDGRTAAQ
ncbi:MAG: hypothetical protein Q4G67_08355, partial [Actinomycetia bacterium]|nr:hypothetical protein [Actinomycetes bacterium]